jgi:hypothetical protein
MSVELQAYWFDLLPRDQRVSALLRYSPTPAPILVKERLGSSSHEVASTSKTDSLVTCALHTGSEHSSSGFLSPSRHQHAESTDFRAYQARLTVRPQRFTRSRRFTPLRTS